MIMMTSITTTVVRSATDTIVADVEKMRMLCCTEETSWMQQRTVE